MCIKKLWEKLMAKKVVKTEELEEKVKQLLINLDANQDMYISIGEAKDGLKNIIKWIKENCKK